MLAKAKEAYRTWHKNLYDFNRIDRNTVGAKIDGAFLSLLEYVFKACFAGDRFEKLSFVSQAIGKSDLVKFLLQLCWEQKIINHSKYGALTLLLDETGRMLGGWKRSLEEKTPAKK
ncbi:four helix bundle protein [Candidatus Falkowbacteria bacterium]|nr:four helix bundle protein [Candidatus Falkowbacteria bacterium]